MRPTTFTLTESHIKLLRNMYISWDGSEYGAPSVDPKRPYGNSWVEGDIHTILTGETDFDLSDELCEEYYKLHNETEIALQIVIMSGKFQPGVYECSKTYLRDWKLISSTI